MSLFRAEKIGSAEWREFVSVLRAESGGLGVRRELLGLSDANGADDRVVDLIWVGSAMKIGDVLNARGRLNEVRGSIGRGGQADRANWLACFTEEEGEDGEDRGCGDARLNDAARSDSWDGVEQGEANQGGLGSFLDFDALAYERKKTIDKEARRGSVLLFLIEDPGHLVAELLAERAWVAADDETVDGADKVGVTHTLFGLASWRRKRASCMTF